MAKRSKAAKERRKRADRLYQRTRMLDIDHRIVRNLRYNIRKHLNEIGNYKPFPNVIELTGCSIDDLKDYLQCQFYDANFCSMNWNNYGKHGWHIDHIQPMSSFDLNDEDELRTACHFSNLQLLWSIHNKEKGDSLTWIHPEDRVPF